MQFEATYGEPLIVPCRVQYVNLVEPDTTGDFPRGNFCLTMLIPKTDTDTMQNVLAACADVAGVQDYRTLKKHPFLNQRKEFRDGDDPNQNPEFKDKARVGHWFCTLGTNKHFDTYVMQDGDFVECNPGEIYDGCYCAVLCTPCQHRDGETTLYLNAVTKVRDGQRLTQRVDPKQAMRNWAGVTAPAQEAQTEQEEYEPEQEAQAPTQPSFGGSAPVVTSNQPAFGGPVTGVVTGSAAMPGQQVTAAATRPKRGRPAGSTNKAPETPGAGPGAVAAAPTATQTSIPNGRSSLSDIMSKS